MWTKIYESDSFVIKFTIEVRNGQPEKFMPHLEAMFAKQDYQIMGYTELYFHNVTNLVFKMLGFYTDVERHTNDERMDSLCKLKITRIGRYFRRDAKHCVSTSLRLFVPVSPPKHKTKSRPNGRDSFLCYRENDSVIYFTFSTMALKSSGWFRARSARTLRLISMPDLVSLSMNWL